MATWRGRRSASGSEVTLMLMRGTLSLLLADLRQGLRHREEVSIPLDAEWADRRASQRLAVGVAEVRDQGSHVRPGGALDLVLGPVVLAPELLEAMHGHEPLRNLDRLAAPSTLICPHAAHLDRRIGRGP